MVLAWLAMECCSIYWYQSIFCSIHTLAFSLWKKPFCLMEDLEKYLVAAMANLKKIQRANKSKLIYYLLSYGSFKQTTSYKFHFTLHLFLEVLKGSMSASHFCFNFIWKVGLIVFHISLLVKQVSALAQNLSQESLVIVKR